MQIVNVYLCRSDRESVFASSLWSNRLILVGIGAELLLILAIDYTHWGNQCVRHRTDWPGCMAVRYPVRVGMLILEEVRKYLSRQLSNCTHP